MRLDVTKILAVLVALAASVTSLQLKVTRDSLELELRRAQAALDEQFSLASCDGPTPETRP